MERVADELAHWASGLCWTGIPGEIQRRAREIWLDTFGCMLLGADHPETIALATMLRERDPDGRTASAVGPVLRLTPLDAILVNGLATGVDILDGGNVASKGHLGGYVMPAVLTAAQASGASFEDALTAFVAGYEAGGRIGASQRLRSTMHPSGSWSVIAAAVAVACLRGADAARLSRTMELAANLTIATSWDAAVHGASVRNLYSAMPSYLGTIANDLASAGFSGGPRSIEVTFGGICSEGEFDAGACVAGFGERWMSAHAYYKLYPTCRNILSVLDAAFDVLGRLQRPFDPERDVVRVGTDPWTYKQSMGYHNDTMLGAGESLPVSVAMCLLFGACTPELFRAGAYADPRVLPLAKRLIVEPIEGAAPTARPGWLEITQGGGEPVRCDVPFPSGVPENPPSAEVLRSKFVTNARPLLGERAPSVAEAILRGPVSVRIADVLPEWLGNISPVVVA